MVENVSLTDAVALLREHFGERLETGRDDGRDLFRDTLREHLAISGGEAAKLVEALEDAHSISWHPGGGDAPGEPQPLGVGPDARLPDSQQTRLVPLQSGYWQL